MDENIKQLLLIIQELERLQASLRNVFPENHPKFDDVFEDIGAGGYYIQEAIYRFNAAIIIAQGGEVDEET
jgi:hypothetical protein